MTVLLSEKLAVPHVAVVVVDMQNDMCHPDGALARFGISLKDVAPLIARLSSFVTKARDHGVRVVFTIHENTPETVSPMRREKHTDRGTDGADVCAKGSWGAQLHEAFSTHPNDLQITKHRYSAFMGTSLDLILGNLGIRTLIVTGMNTNVCVESTVRDAFMHDYYVLIPRDGVATVDPDLHESSLRNFALYFGHVTRFADLLEVWAARRQVARST